MITTENKFVAFIDILGFSQFIEDYDSGNNPAVLSELYNALHTATPLLQKSELNPVNPIMKDWDWKKYLEIKLFSDCICVSTPVEHPQYNSYQHFRFFYMYLSGYINILMEKGFMLRGGLSMGSYYSDDLMIFSGALVKAYLLEKDHAKYPRILIDPVVISHLMQFHTEESASSFNMMFTKDVDERIFLNTFNNLKISSPEADAQARAIIERMRIPGILEEFIESDHRSTLESVAKIERAVKENLERNEKNVNVAEKMTWLLDFIRYYRGEHVARFNNFL